jgi:nitrate/nitrite transporter NarK
MVKIILSFGLPVHSSVCECVLRFTTSLISSHHFPQGSAIIDRFGRRRILLTATAAITCILAIVTGLLSDAGQLSPMRSNAGITFIYLFMVVFSFGWTPM